MSEDNEMLEAAKSLEALSDWLVANDLDMRLPDTIQDPGDLAELIRRAWNTRSPSPVLTAMPESVEALSMARDLIQEAKGAEGPEGGFVTNHLDDAENWLDIVEATLSAQKAVLSDAMRDHLGIESGPNGRGEMRVVVHFPVGKEQALFVLLSEAALTKAEALSKGGAK